MAARILIVEDNPANLDLAKYLLEHAGYAVLLAHDGAEGVAVAMRERPDLVVCDLQMPVMDGFEVLRTLRGETSFGSKPVIAVTAFSMSGDQAAALAAGFDGYLSKPIEPEKFVAQIEAFLAPPLVAQRRPPPVD